jgi:hypothetical protein
MSYGVSAPDYWADDMAADPHNHLDDDLCIIDGKGFFVRGNIVIPVRDHDETFSWNVWVSLSKDNYGRMLEMWERPSRAEEPPYFGWLSSTLPVYAEPTRNLKTRVHTRPPGTRPLIELHPDDHPLAAEQRDGISLERVREIAEVQLHQPEPSLSGRGRWPWPRKGRGRPAR